MNRIWTTTIILACAAFAGCAGDRVPEPTGPAAVPKAADSVVTKGCIASTGCANDTSSRPAPPTPPPPPAPPQPGDSTTIRGVYDLTASVTVYDPAWGYDMSDFRYTATLTFADDPRVPGIVGTFSDLQVTGKDLEPHAPMSGVMFRRMENGRVAIELESRTSTFHLTLVPTGELSGPVMKGEFGCCGHIGGTFTALRREGP